jgi:hypothetical protein
MSPAIAARQAYKTAPTAPQVNCARDKHLAHSQTSVSPVDERYLFARLNQLLKSLQIVYNLSTTEIFARRLLR